MDFARFRIVAALEEAFASLCLGPGAHYALAGVGAEVADFDQVLRKYLGRN